MKRKVVVNAFFKRFLQFFDAGTSKSNYIPEADNLAIKISASSSYSALPI
jgi:hypothetical protein